MHSLSLAGRPSSDAKYLVLSLLLIMVAGLAARVRSPGMQLPANRSVDSRCAQQIIHSDFSWPTFFSPSGKDEGQFFIRTRVGRGKHPRVNSDYPGDGVLSGDETGFRAKGGTIGYVLQCGRLVPVKAVMMRGPPPPAISNTVLPPSSKKCILAPAFGHPTDRLYAYPESGG